MDLTHLWFWYCFIYFWLPGNVCFLCQLILIWAEVVTFLLFEEIGGWRAMERQNSYGDAPRSKIPCLDWFCSPKQGEFDVDDRSSAMWPKSSKRLNEGTMVDVYLCRTRKMLPSASWLPYHAICDCLHASGIIQKQVTGVPHCLKPRDFDRH